MSERSEKERLATLEAEVEALKNDFTQIKDRLDAGGERMDHINEVASDTNTKVQVLGAKFEGLAKSISDSGKRSMWAIGLILTIVNVFVDTVILLSHP